MNILDPLFVGPVWQVELLGNSVRAYVLALVYFVILVGVFWLGQRLAVRRLNRLAERTKNDLDDALAGAISAVRPPVYSLLALYVAARSLALNDLWQRVVDILFVGVLVYQVVHSVQSLINYAVTKRMAETEEAHTRAVINLLSIATKVGLWTLAILFALSNFGVNVTSLIAGLGIGGIAVALAAQNILGDLFGALVIYFDKPFVHGDFVVAGEHKGTVEHVGIKTTRLRALDGEEVVIANKELTDATVRNFRRMEERRVAFDIGVTYDTSKTVLEKIPMMVAAVVGGVPETRFDRAHFREFGDSALIFEVVFKVTTREYEKYMDAREAVNLGIVEAFEREGIEIAFPTQTIHVEQAS